MSSHQAALSELGILPHHKPILSQQTTTIKAALSVNNSPHSPPNSAQPSQKSNNTPQKPHYRSKLDQSKYKFTPNGKNRQNSLYNDHFNLDTHKNVENDMSLDEDDDDGNIDSFLNQHIQNDRGSHESHQNIFNNTHLTDDTEPDPDIDQYLFSLGLNTFPTSPGRSILPHDPTSTANLSNITHITSNINNSPININDNMYDNQFLRNNGPYSKGEPLFVLSNSSSNQHVPDTEIPQSISSATLHKDKHRNQDQQPPTLKPSPSQFTHTDPATIVPAEQNIRNLLESLNYDDDITFLMDTSFHHFDTITKPNESMNNTNLFTPDDKITSNDNNDSIVSPKHANFVENNHNHDNLHDSSLPPQDDRSSTSNTCLTSEISQPTQFHPIITSSTPFISPSTGISISTVFENHRQQYPAHHQNPHLHSKNIHGSSEVPHNTPEIPDFTQRAQRASLTAELIQRLETVRSQQETLQRQLDRDSSRISFEKTQLDEERRVFDKKVEWVNQQQLKTTNLTQTLYQRQYELDARELELKNTETRLSYHQTQLAQRESMLKQEASNALEITRRTRENMEGSEAIINDLSSEKVVLQAEIAQAKKECLEVRIQFENELSEVRRRYEQEVIPPLLESTELISTEKSLLSQRIGEIEFRYNELELIYNTLLQTHQLLVKDNAEISDNLKKSIQHTNVLQSALNTKENELILYSERINNINGDYHTLLAKYNDNIGLYRQLQQDFNNALAKYDELNENHQLTMNEMQMVIGAQQNDVSTANEKIAELQTQVGVLNTQLTEKNGDISSLFSEKDQILCSFNENKQELAQKQQEFASLQEILKNTEKSFNEVQNINNSLKSTLTTKEAQLELQKNTHLQNLENVKHQYSGLLNEQSQKYNILQLERDGLQVNCDECRGTINLLRQQLEDCQNASHKTQEMLKNQLITSNAEIGQFSTLNSGIAKQLSEKSDECDRLEQQNKTLQDEKQSLLRQMEDHNDHILQNALSQQHSDLTAQFNQTLARLTRESEEKYANLQQQNQQIVDSQQITIVSLQHRTEDYLDEIEGIKFERDELLQKIDKLQSHSHSEIINEKDDSFDADVSPITYLSQQVEELTSNNEHLSSIIDALTLKITQMTTQSNEFLNQFNTLTHERDEEIIKNEKLKSDCDLLYLQITELSAQNQQLILTSQTNDNLTESQLSHSILENQPLDTKNELTAQFLAQIIPLIPCESVDNEELTTNLSNTSQYRQLYSQLSQKYQELSTSHQDLVTQHADLDNTHNSLQKLLQLKNDELQSIIAEKQQLIIKNDELGSIISSRPDNTPDFPPNHVVSQLHHQITTQDTQIQTLEKHLASTTKLLQQTETALKNEKELNIALIASTPDISQLENGYKQQIEQVNTQLLRMREEYKNLIDSLKYEHAQRLNEEDQHVTAMKASFDRRTTALKTEMTEKLVQQQKNFGELQKIQQSTAQAKYNEYIALQGKYNELNIQFTDVSNELVSCKDQLNNDRRLTKIQTDFTELQLRFDNLNSDYASSKQRMTDELIYAQKQYDELAQSTSQKVSTLQLAIETMKSEHNNRESEYNEKIFNYLKQIEKLQKDVGNCEDLPQSQSHRCTPQIPENKSANASHTEYIKQLQLEVDALQQQISDYKQNIQYAQKEIRELRTNLSQLERSQKELENTHTDNNNASFIPAHINCDDRYDQLKEQYNDLEIEYNSVKHHLSLLQDRPVGVEEIHFDSERNFSYVEQFNDDNIFNQKISSLLLEHSSQTHVIEQLKQYITTLYHLIKKLGEYYTTTVLPVINHLEGENSHFKTSVQLLVACVEQKSISHSSYIQSTNSDANLGWFGGWWGITPTTTSPQVISTLQKEQQIGEKQQISIADENNQNNASKYNLLQHSIDITQKYAENISLKAENIALVDDLHHYKQLFHVAQTVVQRLLTLIIHYNPSITFLLSAVTADHCVSDPNQHDSGMKNSVPLIIGGTKQDNAEILSRFFDSALSLTYLPPSQSPRLSTTNTPTSCINIPNSPPLTYILNQNRPPPPLTPTKPIPSQNSVSPDVTSPSKANGLFSTFYELITGNDEDISGNLSLSSTNSHTTTYDLPILSTTQLLIPSQSLLPSLSFVELVYLRSVLINYCTSGHREGLFAALQLLGVQIREDVLQTSINNSLHQQFITNTNSIDTFVIPPIESIFSLKQSFSIPMLSTEEQFCDAVRIGSSLTDIEIENIVTFLITKLPQSIVDITPLEQHPSLPITSDDYELP